MTRIEKVKFEALKFLFLVFQRFFNHNGYICADNLYERHASCIDTYTIFKYLQDHGRKSKYIIWRRNLAFEQFPDKKDFITLETSGNPRASSYMFLKKTFWSLLTSKFFICSFYGSLPTEYREFIKNNKDILLVGVGHGPVFLKTLVFKYPFCQDKEWDLYLVCSEHEKKLFERNGWGTGKLLECSLPRFDCCKNVEHSNKKIFIMFTWRLSFEKNRKFIYNSKYLFGIFHLLNNRNLKEYLEKNNVEIVLGLHHALIDICGCNINFPCKLADPNNLIDEINTSDLFITDYSSIFWDSAFLDHPCIFYRMDSSDRFLSDIDKLDIENSNQQDDKLYNVFYDEDDVVDKIKYYVDNGFVLEEEYREKMSQYFYTRRNNTEAFLDILESYNER
jgi:hypothetical protein